MKLSGEKFDIDTDTQVSYQFVLAQVQVQIYVGPNNKDSLACRRFRMAYM